MAGEYSGDFGITAWSVATCTTWPLEDDGARHFPMAFRGERTPVVGRVGVRTEIAHCPLLQGFWRTTSREPEAGRPLLGRPAWLSAHRPGGDDRESAIKNWLDDSQAVI